MALKRCKMSFAATIKGRPQVIKAGQLVDDTDAMFLGHERYFEDVSATVSSNPKPSTPPVEQATAAPGEKRRVGRPPKSRDEKKEADQ